jgi:hypothetical protein
MSARRTLATGVVVGLLWVPAPLHAQSEPAPREIEPIVVTVTRMAQHASDAPASVTIVEQDDIRRSAAQTVDDLLPPGPRVQCLPAFVEPRHASHLARPVAGPIAGPSRLTRLPRGRSIGRV